MQKSFSIFHRWLIWNESFHRDEFESAKTKVLLESWFLTLFLEMAGYHFVSRVANQNSSLSQARALENILN